MAIIQVESDADDFLGIKIITKANWDGICYDFPRERIKNLRTKECANKPSVYHLLDSEMANVYIGHTGNLSERIRTHNAKPPMTWSRAIAFTTMGNFFNASWMKNLEFLLTKKAEDIGRFEIVSSGAQPNNITDSHVRELENFQRGIEEVFLLIGLSIYLPENNAKNAEMLFCKNHEGTADAIGAYENPGFIIKKSSKLKKEIASGSKDYPFVKRREKFLSKGLLTDIGNSYKVREDLLVDSPSMASSLVLGRQSNGKIEWKNKDSISLQDLMKEDTL